jgi:transcriptional regulator with XRE-family HTH domain
VYSQAQPLENAAKIAYADAMKEEPKGASEPRDVAFHEIFAAFLKDSLKARHMSQAKLAEILDLTPGAISHWKKGGGMEVDNLLAVFAALRLNAAAALDLLADIGLRMQAERDGKRYTKKRLPSGGTATIRKPPSGSPRR